MKSAQQIQAALQQFSGTEHLHRWSYLHPHVITDGVLYLAESAKCFWLLDDIAAHQKNPRVSRESFQVWHLTVTGNHAAELVAEDGNGNQIARQLLGYTDFPLPEIKLYAVHNGDGVTLMLPTEY